MAVLEKYLDADSDLGVHPERVGPVRAVEFEAWELDEDNPMELLGGWVVPMSPGTYRTGQVLPDLYRVLYPLFSERGWSVTTDARHQLPSPPETVLYPDLALHLEVRVPQRLGTETVTRVPDLVVEILSKATADRDRAPRGAKFRAYELSGVQEYYYSWPDGREATGFRLEDGVFVPIPADAEGFFASPLLGARLRLVPADLRG